MRPFLSRGALAVAASLLLLSVAGAQEIKTFQRRNPVVEAVSKTKASIVTVRTPRPGGGKDAIGSGVLVDERGILITNKHVVGHAKNVTVRLYDGTDLTGEVLVADPRWDLAIVRITTTKKLIALGLAPADDLMVGESVIAIGHPFGYTNTVSTGIISALGREITMPTGDTITGLIQTDASINPGNSGGALLNVNAELIGINVALREGAQGIAFAINAGDVKKFLSSHLSAVRVSGVEHGLKCEEKVVAETGDRQRVVVKGTPANAELKSGDELRSVGGMNVANAFDVERALWGHRPGEQVALKVVRGGQAMTVQLTLTAGQGAGQGVAQGVAATSRPALPALTWSVPASEER